MKRPNINDSMIDGLNRMVDAINALESSDLANAAALQVFESVINELSDKLGSQANEIMQLRSDLWSSTHMLSPSKHSTGRERVSRGTTGSSLMQHAVTSVSVNLFPALPTSGYAANASLFGTTPDELRYLKIIGTGVHTPNSLIVWVENTANVAVSLVNASVEVVAVVS